VFAKNRNPDNHLLDPLVKPLASRTFLIVISLVAIGAGISTSVIHKDWSWINRFGAIVIVVGLLFTMSPLFSNGIYKSQSGAGRFADLHTDGTLIITTSEERKIGNNIVLGIIVTAIGTLTNAFGDLLAAFVYGF
jgi:cytochrome c biogenesis protein CcdA